MKTEKKENFVGCIDDVTGAKVVLAGVPYDVTSTFRHGSDEGPDSARKYSDSIETFSPDRFDDIADHKIADSGNLVLASQKPEEAVTEIEAYAESFVEKAKKTLYICGEHLISYPIVKSYHKKYPGLKVVYFDAHADMRDHYDGNRLSHSAAARRISEVVGPENIYMFGIRSFEKQEMKFIRDNKILCDPLMEEFENVMDTIKNCPVYISIDVDVIDPGFLPGVGNPEAGGMSYRDFLRAVEGFSCLKNIVAADINELSPKYDPMGASSVFVAKMIREMLLVMAGN
ncbi:MAG TPA: agmatinase [Candidatus Goldiibacteriota bacterium]|nr:agmatinase [Candidatus Goldiibacteriota bacterium]HPN64903.1 agmatinase [Candidatus Goldiibacteriota bacterium]HRQ44746.1 agmatinase [Candidatus Goldiibacteriota bacterium]